MYAPNGNYLIQNNAAIISQINSELTSGKHAVQLKKPFSFSEKNQCIWGEVSNCGRTHVMHFRHIFSRTKELFQNALNLQLATGFWNGYMDSFPATQMYRIEFVNVSLTNVKMKISDQTGRVSNVECDPLNKDLSQRIYDFATGQLNVGLIENMFEAEQKSGEEDRKPFSHKEQALYHLCGIDMPYYPRDPLPVAPGDPSKKIKMPFIELK